MGKQLVHHGLCGASDRFSVYNTIVLYNELLILTMSLSQRAYHSTDGHNQVTYKWTLRRGHTWPVQG